MRRIHAVSVLLFNRCDISRLNSDHELGRMLSPHTDLGILMGGRCGLCTCLGSVHESDSSCAVSGGEVLTHSGRRLSAIFLFCRHGAQESPAKDREHLLCLRLEKRSEPDNFRSRPQR